MKTLKVAPQKLARELEKKLKKPAADFAQVLQAQPQAQVQVQPLPLPHFAVPKATATLVVAAKEHAPPQKQRPAPAKHVEEPKLQIPLATQTPSAPTASTKEVTEAPPAAFIAQLPEDPSLRMNVSPNAAAISIQTANAGDLSLYLRVRDGNAELRMTGAAAPLLERRSDELRLALATEGITLQRLEIQTTVTAASESSASGFQASSSDRQQQQQQHAHEPLDRDEPGFPATAAKATSTPARAEAGHHVRA